MPPRDTQTALNANSAILGVSSAIILGVLSWVGIKTADNANSMARIEATLPYVNQALTDLKSQLATFITRSEFDARVNALERRIATLEAEHKSTTAR